LSLQLGQGVLQLQIAGAGCCVASFLQLCVASFLQRFAPLTPCGCSTVKLEGGLNGALMFHLLIGPLKDGLLCEFRSDKLIQSTQVVSCWIICS
jgi:hypothetical protein